MPRAIIWMGGIKSLTLYKGEINLTELLLCFDHVIDVKVVPESSYNYVGRNFGFIRINPISPSAPDCLGFGCLQEYIHEGFESILAKAYYHPHLQAKAPIQGNADL